MPCRVSEVRTEPLVSTSLLWRKLRSMSPPGMNSHSIGSQAISGCTAQAEMQGATRSSKAAQAVFETQGQLSGEIAHPHQGRARQDKRQ